MAAASAPRRSSAQRSSASVDALRVTTPSDGEQRKRNVSPLPNDRRKYVRGSESNCEKDSHEM